MRKLCNLRAVLGALFLAAFLLQAEAKAAGGTLIVLNKSDATASLISLANGKTLATLPTNPGPHEVAVSPDGKIAVVTNYGRGRNAPGSSLTVIDVERLRVTKTITLGAYQRPHGILFLPGKNKVLVTAEAQRAIIVVDLDAKKVEKAISTDQNVSHMVVYSPKHGLAFVANIGSGSVSVIDLTAAKLVKNISTGQGAEGIALSPNEREVWVTNRGDDSISIVDAAKLEVSVTLPCPSFPIRAKFSPDGRYVFVSSARSGELVVFDAIARKALRRVAMTFKVAADQEGRLFRDRFGESPVPVGILVHPDGKFAYVANTQADVVAIVDLQKWQVSGILEPGHEPDGLGYSPLTPEVVKK